MTNDGDITCRTFRLRIDSINETERTVDAAIATEAPVTVIDYARFEPINEILLMSGASFPKERQVPMLDSHDRTSVRNQLGSTRNLRIEGDQLVGTNHFSKRQAADDVFTMVKEKHLTDNSIGYRVLKFVTIEPGRRQKVEGRFFKAPDDRRLRVTTSWQVVENSIVTIGADSAAKNRSDKNAGLAGMKRNLILKGCHTMNFTKWLANRGLKAEDFTDDQLKNLRDDYDRQIAANAAADNGRQAAKDNADLADEFRKGKKAEQDRVIAIRGLAGNDIPADVVQGCIDDANCTVEQAQRTFLETLRAKNAAQTGSPAIIIRNSEAAADDLINGMVLRAGYDDEIQELATRDQKAADQSERFRDVSVVDLCRMCLQIDRVEPPFGRNEMIARAMSTTTLPKILGAVANKSLLRGYNLAPQTWREWTTRKSVSNFQTQTAARLTDAGGLVKVPNSGEVAHGTQIEEYETYSLATYAKQFSVTRQDVINDNLGAFTATPQRMGQKANQRVSQLIYETFMANSAMADSVAVFHSTHSNLATSAALASAKLAAAVVLFMNQTDADGEVLDVSPAFLLVPPTLYETAKNLLQADYIIATDHAGTASTTGPGKNIHKGTLKLIIEPRLENSSYTNYSTTTWYISGSPGQIDTVAAAFLNGKDTPTIDRVDDPDVLGIGYLVYIDAGSKALDYRGMVKNTA